MLQNASTELSSSLIAPLKKIIVPPLVGVDLISLLVKRRAELQQNTNESRFERANSDTELQRKSTKSLKNDQGEG